jgi:hypothetical protein
MVLASDCKSESNTDQRDLEMRDLASVEDSDEKQTSSVSVQSSGFTMPESEDTDSNGENEPQIQVIVDESSTEKFPDVPPEHRRAFAASTMCWKRGLKDSTMPR